VQRRSLKRHKDTFTLASRCRNLPAAINWESSPDLKNFWQSWRRDLNPRPSDYKSDALPTELRQHGANRGNITKGYLNCKAPLWKTCANLDHLPVGSLQSPHLRSILKSVLEKPFYTFRMGRGKAFFCGANIRRLGTFLPERSRWQITFPAPEVGGQ
jgi:hypothetical protein